MAKKQKARREFNRGGLARGREESRVAVDKAQRNRYTIRQKITIVQYAMVRMEEDLASMNDISSEIGISTSSLSRWIDQLPVFRHIDKNDQVRLAINPHGRRSQLEDIGADLLAFVEDMREKGYAARER